MWDKRYDTDKYVYGTTPNDFLTSMIHKIPMGQVLCLAEGEGRNGVYLAEKGYDVLGVDSSKVGLAKAQKLAAQKGVTIETVVADLGELRIQPNRYSGIVSIFAHLPKSARRSLHRGVVEGLCSGGVFILEAYTPKQIEYKTGGPPTAELMMTLKELEQELNGLQFEHAVERIRLVREGTLHHGDGAVVQVVARKP